MASSPAFKINLNSEVFDKMKGKKSRYIRPSAIAIEPNTGDIYITEGVKPKLLILDSKGKAKSLHKLGSEFDQPEGLGFSPDGKLFISNEGKGDPGNIIQLQSLNLN
jgi:DNA-binding beta-propeller fold protein YncE